MKKGAKTTRNNGLKAKGLRHKGLTTEREQLERWKEHFREILNQDEPDTFCDLGSERAREMLNVNLSDISLEEVRSGLRKLKNNKAAGADDIQPELLIYGGNKT